MADSTLANLTENTAPAATDIIYVVTDPSGTPANAKVTLANAVEASVGQPGGTAKIVRKATTESVTSSTTLQNDDELLFAIAANETWVARWAIFCDGATGGDIKIAFTWPSGATVTWMGLGFDTAQGGSGVGDIGLLGHNASGSSNTFGTPGFLSAVYVDLSIANGANAGNVQLQWAQGTSSGTATRVLAGAHVVAHRLA